jgi:predicted CoA-binding protein
MPSTREDFWTQSSFVFIGDSRGKRAFPKLSYAGAKKLGKNVYAVDPAGGTVEGDPVYTDLASLPAPVDAAVLEVPKEDTASWVGRVADAGIKNVWLHQQTDTPEALQLARERGLRTEHGTCAVMYVRPGFSGHAIHRFIMKLTKKY